jgi:hypothetical protein
MDVGPPRRCEAAAMTIANAVANIAQRTNRSKKAFLAAPKLTSLIVEG